jgi:hypothetical protein
MILMPQDIIAWPNLERLETTLVATCGSPGRKWINRSLLRKRSLRLASLFGELKLKRSRVEDGKWGYGWDGNSPGSSPHLSIARADQGLGRHLLKCNFPDITKKKSRIRSLKRYGVTCRTCKIKPVSCGQHVKGLFRSIKRRRFGEKKLGLYKFACQVIHLTPEKIAYKYLTQSREKQKKHIAQQCGKIEIIDSPAGPDIG